jgi:hypothetical protein
MEWTRSETIGLAAVQCTTCRGIGLKPGRGAVETPCACTLRAIFRSCYTRFRQCIEKEKTLSRVTLECGSKGGGRVTWSRKDEEYIADFYLVTRRNLSASEWKLFSYHFLLGAGWRLCAKKLGLDRGQFFHQVYRLEAQLGKIYRELHPYALYPVDEYFAGRTENDWPAPGKVVRMRPGSLHQRLKVPVKKAA